MPAANIIKIGLKLYQEDGLGVSTKGFDMPAPEGYQRGKKSTIKVEDATTSVTVSINGTKLAVVERCESEGYCNGNCKRDKNAGKSDERSFLSGQRQYADHHFGRFRLRRSRSRHYNRNHCCKEEKNHNA